MELQLDLDATVETSGNTAAPLSSSSTRFSIVKGTLVGKGYEEGFDQDDGVFDFAFDGAGPVAIYGTPSLTFDDPSCSDSWTGWGTQPGTHADIILSAGASALPDDEDAGQYGEPPKPPEPTMQLLTVAPRGDESSTIERDCVLQPPHTEPLSVPVVSALELLIGFNVFDRPVMIPTDGSDITINLPAQNLGNYTASATVRVAVDVQHG